MNIRLGIADDHFMIIGGLQNMLSNYPHITLIGTYQNGAELLEKLKKEIPDVLLLDIQLPDRSGDQLAPIILKKYPSIRILTLTNLESSMYVYNMLRHGALGYVLKNTDPDTLIEAIETVYRGEEFIEPSLKEKLHQFTLTMKKEAAVKLSLTSREKEILQLIVNGDTSHEIAEKLFIGFRTVEYYRLNMLLKLDVKNTASLVKKALQLGLVD